MRKAVYHTLLLLLPALSSFAQRPVSFAEIDERVKSIEPAIPGTLAYTLTKDYATDKEKFRSIFSWIADHISYRVRNSFSNHSFTAHARRLVFSDSNRWVSANEIVAETVLQNGSAVCDGYARLFKTLCDYAGLRSAIITGFARGDMSRQLKFRSNHTWNAVYVDSTWRLLDVTWASGYTSYRGDDFIKFFNDEYFLTAPETFILDHVPDDLRWTLMDNPPSPPEYKGAPYKNRAFGKYKITAFVPQDGIIEAVTGDTLEIVLETADAKADRQMASDTITAFDSSMNRLIASMAFLQPEQNNTKNDTRLRYRFVVKDDNTAWLQLMYNHDTVLRYSLQRKKEKQIFW